MAVTQGPKGGLLIVSHHEDIPGSLRELDRTGHCRLEPRPRPKPLCTDFPGFGPWPRPGLALSAD